MKKCRTCGSKMEFICKNCGSAVIEDESGIVYITPINYNPERMPEISQKYMAPLIEGTIQRLQKEKGVF